MRGPRQASYTRKVSRRFSAFLAPLLLGLSACDVPHHAQTTPTAQTTTQPTTITQTQKQTAQTTSSTRASGTDPVSGLRWMSVSELPREGQQVLKLIAQGGPFRYSKDGATFGNREGMLPRHNRRYYREYTVTTPGASNRGTRRIICGGQNETSTAECYYTHDHYATFRRIRP